MLKISVISVMEFVFYIWNYYFVKKADFAREIWFTSLPDFFVSDADYGFYLKEILAFIFT